MTELLNIGFGNLVNTDKIAAIVLSSLGPDTLAGRFHELSGGKEEE